MSKEQRSTSSNKSKTTYQEKLIPTDSNLKSLEESFDKVRNKVIQKAKGTGHIEFVETSK